MEKVEKVNCEIRGQDWELTEEEFEFTKRILGYPDREVSLCCGADVDEHSDHTSRCLSCKEFCEVVYVWDF